MTTRGYGIFGTANNMFIQYREKKCISEYIKSKAEIEQQIDKLQKTEPSHFCSKCVAMKERIHAENNKINNCHLSNSKSLKLIDDNIKDFIEECIEYPKCVLNRTSSIKKTVTSERASAGKDKQQSRGDSKTSKPGDSRIKGSPGKDQNPTDGKALTKANPIPHNPDGIKSSLNSGEAQKEASKQMSNPPTRTSGIIETQAQKISQSVHSQVTETDPHSSGSIKGTPNGEDHMLKPTKLTDLTISISQSGSPSGEIAKDKIVKNQDSDDGASFTEISDTGDHVVKGVGTDACSKTQDGKETCDEEAVVKDSSPVTSNDASTKLDITPDEYACSEDDFDELFGSHTHPNEVPDRETSSSIESGDPALGIAPHTAVLNRSTDEDRELTVLLHSHNIHVTEGVSDINMCQQTSDIVSTPRCVHSNNVIKFEKHPQKEIPSEKQKNDDQVSGRPSSHQVDQLNQRVSEQQVGQLHYEQESSLPEDERLGGKHYIIKDIFQHLHLQKNCSLR
ncbi:hypothetical protein PVBG_05445 [Plasmodium vivax Brazil I]|uniref:VIR protein n=1 Tax=Plasmodium vivax (strain Brazil I) TaxID=1033975 RepID=A0A0J9T1M2_PLAV1|nr:hypothetical protein PVBG_05445 [Plasmodium vivax Brazil I]